jgi:carbonic anhydrase
MVHNVRKVGLFCLLIAVALVATACSLGISEEVAAPAEHADPHWSYEGESGPENWGALGEKYILCSRGQAQSPIDITAATPQDVVNILFNYHASKVNILNNGHTVQVEYDAGSSIELDGTTYALKQFHFHAPSEHLLNGASFTAELHLVHQNTAGARAVVGVLIQEGAENENLASVWEHLPAREQAVHTIDGATVNADALLPADRLSYRYDGSLTTPPCDEEIEWLVLTTPIEMSSAQITALQEIVHHNSRPVQPLHNRELVEDTSAN